METNIGSGTGKNLTEHLFCFVFLLKFLLNLLGSNSNIWTMIKIWLLNKQNVSKTSIVFHILVILLGVTDSEEPNNFANL